MSTAPVPVSLRERFLVAGGLPTRRHTYTPVELFLFSAATWNPHRIHYDQAYVSEATGGGALVVQGPLQAAHMFLLLDQHLAPGATVREVEYRHVAPLSVGEAADIGGDVVSVDGSGAAVEVWVEKVDSGIRTTVGVARVTLGGRTEGGET